MGKFDKYKALPDGYIDPDLAGIQRDSDGFLRLHRVDVPMIKESKLPVKAEVKKKKDPLDDKPGGFRSILYTRIDGRPIPKVDEGIKDPDRNISDEGLKEYFAKNHIAEYVHMERVDRGKGTVSINRLKFEFSYMLSGYMRSVADSDDEVMRRISYAEVSKKSFINKMNNSLRYINYFIEYFDDDDELMSAYLNMMVQIMSTEIDLDPETFLESLYAYFSTDSLIEKIARMVEYNTDETLIKKTDRSYDESIQLTLDHLKAIMAVSCIHKFIIPIVGHYYCMKSRVLKNHNMTDKDLYMMAFGSFMSVFDEYYDIELYEKLYCTAGTRIKKTINRERAMWNRRYRFGTTTVSYANQLMKDFIVDISQKAVFSKSAIIYIHVCFDDSIRTELIQPDKWEFTEMKMEASDSVNETMSRFDKWQTDKAFHSQKDRIRAFVSIKDAIQWLGQRVGIDFAKMDNPDPDEPKKVKKWREEFNFYRENIVQPMSNAQLYIIQLYYASLIGTMDDTEMLEMTDIFKLIMIMKRDFDSRNFKYLRFFISSNMIPAADHRYNKRRLEKLFQQHPAYEDWIDQYPDTKVFNMSRFFDEVRPIISTPIKVCDYDYVEFNDHKMFPSDINVVDELIRMMMAV